MRTLQAARWTTAQLALTAVVLVAGVIAALTLSVPAAVPTDTLRLVGQAASAAEAAGSYRMELDVQMEGSGLALDVTGTADIVAETGEGTGKITLPGLGQAGGQTLRFLVTPDRGWFELPEGSPQRLGGKEWISFPVDTAQGAVTQDPLSFLELLSDDGQVQDMGGEEIRGVETRQYRTAIDAAALGALAEEQDNPMLSSDVAKLMDRGQADVWISEDGLPRRVRVEIEAQGVTVAFAFDLFEYGLPVNVTPPPAGTVVSVDSQEEAMQFLSGQ